MVVRERMNDSKIAVHREDAKLTIELHLLAEFAQSYEGDDDGFEWLRQFRTEVQPKLLQALAGVLREAKQFQTRPITRGRNPEEHLEFEIRLQPRARLPLGVK
jgi:hypothetical protein